MGYNRRKILGLTGSIVIGSGCIDQTDDSSSASNPTSNTETSTQTESPTMSPSPSDSDNSSENCSPPDGSVYNGTENVVSLQITITDKGSRYRGPNSPSATKAEDSTPSETSNRVFEDSLSLASKDRKSYDNIPLGSGRNVVTVSVEGREEESFDLDSGDLTQQKQLNIGIFSDSINISISSADCSN